MGGREGSDADASCRLEETENGHRVLLHLARGLSRAAQDAAGESHPVSRRTGQRQRESHQGRQAHVRRLGPAAGVRGGAAVSRHDGRGLELRRRGRAFTHREDLPQRDARRGHPVALRDHDPRPEGGRAAACLPRFPEQERDGLHVFALQDACSGEPRFSRHLHAAAPQEGHGPGAGCGQALRSSEAALDAVRGEKTRVIDAGHRTVIPGLNDAHTHFIRGGLTYTSEVRWDGVPSLAEGMLRVGEQARRTPPPHWVQVIGGWTWAQFAEKRFPTLEEINAATGDTPCMIMHLYDRAWLNRSAIRVLGWEREVPKLFGGFVERDAGGNPTGLVMSTTSLASLVAVWLRVPRLSPEEQVTSARHFMREHNRLGVTSVIDAGGGGQNYPENYAAIAKLAADKLLALRIGYEVLAQPPGKELVNYLAEWKVVRIGEGNDY